MTTWYRSTFRGYLVYNDQLDPQGKALGEVDHDGCLIDCYAPALEAYIRAKIQKTPPSPWSIRE